MTATEAGSRPAPLVVKGKALPAQVSTGTDDLGMPDASDVRMASLRALWFASPLKSERGCRRWGASPDVDQLPVRTSTRKGGGVTVGVGGLRTCGHWHEPVCGTKIAMERAGDDAHALRLWAAAGEVEGMTMVRGPVPKVSLVRGHVPKDKRKIVPAGGCAVISTFSVQHHLGHRLEEMVIAMRAASKAISSGRAAQDFRRRMGVAWQVRVFECTHGDVHGWHPHFHYLFLINGAWRGESADPFVRQAFRPLWDLWVAELAKYGFSAVAEVHGESAGFDAKLIDLTSPESIRRVAGYINKGHETTRTATWSTGATLADQSGSAARELDGGVWKAGKAPDSNPGHRHRSIAQVIEDYAFPASAESAEQDKALIVEFKLAMRKLRMPQRKPSPGMRAAFVALAAALEAKGVIVPGQLTDVERTDEEIAAAEDFPDAVTVGHIRKGAWAAWFAWELPALRAAGRMGGQAAVLAYLSDPARNTDGDGSSGLGFEPFDPLADSDVNVSLT